MKIFKEIAIAVVCLIIGGLVAGFVYMENHRLAFNAGTECCAVSNAELAIYLLAPYIAVILLRAPLRLLFRHVEEPPGS